ncbi:MAG: cytochrome C oxidase subunit II, partial [Treponema sp.]|nr:cytochrome C oxidase subunit II [Treponema sp.]
YIENLKNARELLVREYEDTDTANLPDERYQVRMRYYDNAQLIEERKSYDVQMKSFETEIEHLWDLLFVIYEDGKSGFKVTDFTDLAKKNRNRVRKLVKEKTGEPLYEHIAKVWDEITFVKPAETDVERMNRTYIYEKDKIKQRLIIMRDKMAAMYDYRYPIARRVMEDRLNSLEKDYFRFDYMINPYHIQPGLFLEVDITSIKRKKATLNAMANVLNEFLHGVSKGFQDAAFASFSRRRSTVREDINQSFSDASQESAPAAVAAPGQAYLDMLNTADSSASPAAAAPKSRAKAAEVKPSKRGRQAGRPRRGIKEV